MPRFFVNASSVVDGLVTVSGDDAHHISRSLRMASGDRIVVSDGNLEYECELEEFLPDRVTARVLSAHSLTTEPPYRVHLYQALPKGEKLDTIVQKAVECGVSEIIPFESEYCVVRVKQETEEKKTERRQRIALEAAKQSGRGRIPTVLPSVSFGKMLELASAAELPLFCYEGDGTEPLKRILQNRLSAPPCDGIQDVSVVIGSEGGFSPEEAERARSAGMFLCNLGKRILRTETASGFVLSCLVYELEL